MDTEIQNFFDSVTATVGSNIGMARVGLLAKYPMRWSDVHRDLRADMFENRLRYAMFLRAMNAICTYQKSHSNPQCAENLNAALWDWEFARYPALFFGLKTK